MLTSSYCKHFLVVAIVLTLIPALLSAAPRDDDKGDLQCTLPEHVRDRLNNPAFDWKAAGFKQDDEISLESLLAFLADRTGLSFDIDDRAFMDAKLENVRRTNVKMDSLWHLHSKEE